MFDLLTENQIQSLCDFLKPRLSKKRFTHSVNVANEAQKLAKKYGVDTDSAFIAGYLHDCAKELSQEEQKELMSRSDFPIDKVEYVATPLFHAIAGAVVVREQLGITDAGILTAIRYHTVAAPNMSGLSEVIYLADLISEDRDYKDVKHMRKLSYESLNGAMLEALRFSINDSVKKGNAIPVSTLLAYNDYVQRNKLSKEKRENN